MSNQTFNTKAITVGGRIRFSYVKAFKAEAMTKNGKVIGEPKFSVQILIKKDDTENITIIKNAMQAAYQKGLSEKWSGVKPEGLRSPLRDGDTTDLTKNPERKGCFFMNVSCAEKNPPVVVGPNPKIRITDPKDFYSGCFGNIAINFFPYNTLGDGVSAGLQNIQKTSDGENLGGGASNPEADFGGGDYQAAADDFMS